MPITPTGNTQARPDIASAIETFDIESDRLGFIGYRLFPVLEVGEQFGKFPKLDTRLWLGQEDTRRASGGNYNQVSFKTGEDQYATYEHGLECSLDDREGRIYRNWFNYEVIRARGLIDKIRRAAEIRIAKAAFDPSNFNPDQVVSVMTPWDQPDSDPIADFDSMRETFYGKNGVYPTGAVMSQALFWTLRRNEQIKSEIRSEGAGQSSVVQKITEGMLAEVLGLEQILVAGGATAKNYNPGRDDAGLLSSIWDKTRCGLFCIPKSEDLAEPAFGRTFHWAEDGSSIGGTVEEYYDDGKRGSILRVRHEVEEKTLLKDLGCLFTNCMTSG